MPSLALAQAKAANSAHSCDLPGCQLRRASLERWCASHTRTAARLGHPLARAYRPKEWATHRKEVSSLLSVNTGHAGYLQVLQFLADWMARAANDADSFKGAKEVAALAAAGVTPHVLLLELCAAFAWLSERPHALPDDLSRDVFLSRAVFGLRPRPRRPCGPNRAAWGRSAKTPQSYAVRPARSALVHVGQHLRRVLAVFLCNVVSTLEAERLRKADPAADQRAPLRSPAAASALPFPR
jgi:hypothetical protein